MYLLHQPISAPVFWVLHWSIHPNAPKSPAPSLLRPLHGAQSGPRRRCWRGGHGGPCIGQELLGPAPLGLVAKKRSVRRELWFGVQHLTGLH